MFIAWLVKHPMSGAILCLLLTGPFGFCAYQLLPNNPLLLTTSQFLWRYPTFHIAVVFTMAAPAAAVILIIQRLTSRH